MRPGFYELMIGRKVGERFTKLNLGDHVKFRDAEWTIVGVFSSNADLHETEILTDCEMLLSATHRNAVNSVAVLLKRPDSFAAFRAAIAADVSLPVKVYRESDYYKLQSEPLKDAWSFVAYVVSAIMALGAMFGAANTMYSAVSARTVELATLRALGFGSGAIVISVLIEATLFAILGALLGAAIVWAAFSGHTFSARLGNGHVATQLSLDALLVLLGVGWGCAISVLGALIPAIQVVRQPIAEAIRAS
jgi:putative ABC transport system permease protein